MIAGLDYKKRTRTRFVIYAVLVGPPLGTLMLAVFINLQEVLDPELYLLGYVLGSLQALTTALFIYFFFRRNDGVDLMSLLVACLLGWFCGNLVGHYLFITGMRSGDSLFWFTEVAPLIFGTCTTLTLWFLRPGEWIGPLTKEELDAWRLEQREASA